jgi:SynChlorMet cassette radical SAM/SPASM protein ScmE
MLSPRVVSIALTSACNQHCGYCFFHGTPTQASFDLPTAEWLSFIDELGRSAVLRVELTGGEPFLREDLPEIISQIVKNRMRFSLITNATLIDDGMAAFIASTGRCDELRVSLDGGRAEVHDSLRGKGTFDRAVSGIKALVRHGLPVMAMVTLHRGNYRHLPETASFALDELEVRNVMASLVTDLGECHARADSLRLTAAERTEAIAKVIEITERYGDKIVGNRGIRATTERWASLVEACDLGQRTSYVQPEYPGYFSSCGIATKAFYVRSDGVFVPCFHMAHIELGRVGRDDFITTWREHDELKRLRARNSIPLASIEGCDRCRFRAECTGGCPAFAYAACGDELKPDPDTCLKLFLESGGSLPMRETSR